MSGQATLRATLLGTGASGGVPRADGDWGVCDPQEPRNRRTRCGLLLQRWRGAPSAAQDATTVLIDTPPELRQQLAGAGVRHLDGVVFSHEHADQTHGIDDVRPFAQRKRRAISVYMDAVTGAILRPRFSYIFDGVEGYPAILSIQAPISAGAPLTIDGPGGPLVLTPLQQDHGLMPSLGFRSGAFAYCNDVVMLPPETLAALEGLAVFVVDALRYEPHPTHANVARALEWIAALQPARAILTNLHIDLDYRTLQSALPAGVEPGYDGLHVDLPAV
jgi:phosphoribosyl 1,2-cyclic phosphate phosphodiesterase